MKPWFCHQWEENVICRFCHSLLKPVSQTAKFHVHVSVMLKFQLRCVFLLPCVPLIIKVLVLNYWHHWKCHPFQLTKTSHCLFFYTWTSHSPRDQFIWQISCHSSKNKSCWKYLPCCCPCWQIIWQRWWIMWVLIKFWSCSCILSLDFLE